ncbi:MAG: glycosyltransferase [Patescibacteria group bacterium]|nr:glycosyltransferase [Patescibacteria group bacterium]
MKIFIVWGRETELSRYLAQGLGAELKQVYIKKLGKINLPALIRYCLQTVKTLFILGKGKPEAVIVQNPPIFCALICYFYCTIAGAKLAIDSHTAAFLDRKWIFFHWLFKFVAKGADLNTCHNFKNLAVLKKWGIAPAMVIQFYNPVYKEENLKLEMKDKKITEQLEESKLPIMMVNRFASDDDWSTVLAAANLLPEATFFITGNPSVSLEKRLAKDKPDNACFTGYLTHEEFMRLMWRCRVVLAFTLRPDTVLWSIREIMALGKPFVTTDSEVLRHYFGEAALFTKSAPEELKEKIMLALKNENQIKEKIKFFLEKDKKRWQREIFVANKILNNKK